MKLFAYEFRSGGRQPLLRTLNRALVSGFVLALGVGAVANDLEDIQFSDLPGDQFEVRMRFSETPPTPEGYRTDQPARIVVDLPGVTNALNARNFPLSVDNAESANVVSAGDRTRLVVNLIESANYVHRIEGNELILEIGGTGGVVSQADQTQSTQAAAANTAAAVTTTRQTTASPNVSRRAAENQITMIDFRRGEQGDGRVIIDLPTPNVGIDMRESRGAIEITFEGLEIPEDIRRRYDVTDFATPVNFVDADNGRLGGVVRVEASGFYEYLAYQADDQYVLSVKPLSPREVEQREAETYTGQKISLQFGNIEVRQVLSILATVADFDLVVSDNVSGTVALRLTNVPWDQALDIVLKTKGLDKRQEGRVMRIAPAAEIAEQERQELETKRQLQELAPLRTEYIRISYADARDLYNLFQATGEGEAGSLLSERGSAVVDDRTNSIILTDTADKITQFRQLVDELDTPNKQVLIEARIVIANTDFRKEMGVRWGAAGVDTPQNSITELTGSYEGLDSDPGAPADFFLSGGTLELQETTMVDLGVTNPSGRLAFDIISNNIFLAAELSALEDSGQAEIVSQPKVIAEDKETAMIQSGTQIPYQEASASGATSTSFVDAVLKLEVTPQITPDNNIILDLAINQDSVGDIDVASGIPVIDITQIETKILVRDGETIVLGGIYQTSQQDGVIKVPFLGDIPYLGALFRQNVHREEKSELLIFITPRIQPDTIIR